MNIKALLKSLKLRKFNTGLLILQLALTVGLIVNSAILSMDTYSNLEVDTGMDNENILITAMNPTSGDFKDQDYARSIAHQDLAALRNIPGVKSVTQLNQLPLQRGGWNGNVYDLDDPEIEQRNSSLRYIPFFLTNEDVESAFGLQLVEGRFLTDADRIDDNSENATHNIVISESLKKALYGDKSALGEETSRGFVVGVVKDILVYPHMASDRQHALFMNRIDEYIRFGRHYALNVEPGQMAFVREQVRDVILGVEPQRDIYAVFTMAEHFKKFYRDDQGLANLFILLTGLMLLVTAISSYAYSQFHITQQTKFIGIRRALGATKRDIMLYVLTENWLLYAFGSILGLAVMIGFNILLSQHIKLSKPDFIMTGLAVAVIFISGTLATWLPARKTSKIAPVIATRSV